MVRIARMVSFFVAAIGVEIASGIGLAALLIAALLGWKRAGAHWLLAPAVAGAIAALALSAGASSGGKIDSALSNGVFLLFVYVDICLVGYGLGALARRWR